MKAYMCNVHCACMLLPKDCFFAPMGDICNACLVSMIHSLLTGWSGLDGLDRAGLQQFYYAWVRAGPGCQPMGLGRAGLGFCGPWRTLLYGSNLQKISLTANMFIS